MAIEIKNPGVSQDGFTIQQWAGVILMPRSFIDTITNLETQQTWQDKLVAAKGARFYMFPASVESENTDEEDSYWTTNMRKKIKLAKGMYSHKFHMTASFAQHRNIATFDGTKWGAAIFDTEGRMLLTYADDAKTTGKGVKCNVYVEKLNRNDNSKTTTSVLSIDIDNPNDIDLNGFVIDAAFINNLIPLTTVDLAVVGTPSATSYTLSVKNELDGTGILGLVAADFTMLSGATGLTDNDDGTYTFAGSGMATGSTDLKAASALSIQAYESSGPVTVTIA